MRLFAFLALGLKEPANGPVLMRVVFAIFTANIVNHL